MAQQHPSMVQNTPLLIETRVYGTTPTTSLPLLASILTILFLVPQRLYLLQIGYGLYLRPKLASYALSNFNSGSRTQSSAAVFSS